MPNAKRKLVLPAPSDKACRLRPGAELPPAGLSAARIQLGNQEYVVLSFPLQRARAFPQLTDAEHDVVDHVLDGKSNAEIARDRGTVPRTIANQLAAIYRKLGVGSRAELTALAALSGPDPSQTDR